MIKIFISDLVLSSVFANTTCLEQDLIQPPKVGFIVHKVPIGRSNTHAMGVRPQDHDQNFSFNLVLNSVFAFYLT